MSQWSPCKRNDSIARLYRLGFKGPFSGAKHHFMVYKEQRLTIPSNREYSVPQLKMMLKEVEFIIGRKITIEEWSTL